MLHFLANVFREAQESVTDACMHALPLIFNECNFARCLMMCREILNTMLTREEIECVTVLIIDRAHFVRRLVFFGQNSNVQMHIVIVLETVIDKLRIAESFLAARFYNTHC